MAFESLTDKLQNVFKNLRSKGRLTEADVKASDGRGCQVRTEGSQDGATGGRC